MRVYLYILLSALLGLPPFRPIEQSLEERMTGGADGVEGALVRISAARLSFLFLGFCRRVVVEVRGLRFKGLRTEAFRIEIEGLRLRPFQTFIMNRARVRGADSVTWSITLRDEDLEAYIRSKGPPAAGVQVRFAPEGVTLHRPAGLASLFSLTETFTLCARLRVNRRKDLYLEMDHLSAFGFSPGRIFARAISTIVNPVIEAKAISGLLASNEIEVLENLAPYTTLENITLETGKAMVKGAVELHPCAPKKECTAEGG